MPTIRLDDDVFAGLKSLAEPFTDTPNSVIRRILQERGTLPAAPGAPGPPPQPSRERKAARNGSPQPRSSGQTPQPTYEKYLLHVLATHFKGKGEKSEVTKAVLAMLQAQGVLTAADRETVSTGETKAANTIAWGRNALKERGLIRRMSPRGVWELTEKGLKEGLELRL